MKKSLLIIPLLLAGCAKVSDYQTSCEQRYARLSDMANCLDASVKNDSRMASAPTPKLYVLAAKMLGQGVDEGKISDAQARLELQNLYVRLQSQEQAQQIAQSQAFQQALLNYQTINTMQAIQQKSASASDYSAIPYARRHSHKLQFRFREYRNLQQQ